MKLADLHYDLPPELIAQRAVEPRDHSRLLVLDRAGGERTQATFRDLPRWLPSGALLVVNNTRVLPARLRLRRPTGGKVDGLFLHEESAGVWHLMMTPAGRLRAGERLTFEDDDRALQLIARVDDMTWSASPDPPGDAHAILMKAGHTPLPPYIRRDANAASPPVEPPPTGYPVVPPGDTSPHQTAHPADADRYQTVYAKRPGAVAAPTAGLHFTPRLMDELRAARFGFTSVTLHVGAGTFLPVRCANLEDHPMHAEWYDCSPTTAEAINAARDARRPIVAVGTTSVRVLETVADDAGRIVPGSGWTRLLIYPPYRFRAVDALVTNFHLPESTLLAMLFAFAGREGILAAYAEAIHAGYRFYSYGDAMLIL